MKRFFLLFAISAFASAQSVHSLHVATRYQANSWGQTPAIPGAIHGFLPVLPQTFLNGGVCVTNTVAANGFAANRICIYHADGNRSEIVVKECADFSSAKNALLSRLGLMQSTETIPMGTNGFESIGDVCLSDASPTCPGLTLFVRNNVCVSCSTDVSFETMTNLVFSIDAQLCNAVGNDP